MTPDTNNRVQKPKCGRGRPKKYFTEEERKKADRGYVKRCMENNPYYCSVCDHTYHMDSKSKHIKSNKHIRNFQKYN